jgi:hypothetical protein
MPLTSCSPSFPLTPIGYAGIRHPHAPHQGNLRTLPSHFCFLLSGFRLRPVNASTTCDNGTFRNILTPCSIPSAPTTPRKSDHLTHFHTPPLRLWNIMEHPFHCSTFHPCHSGSSQRTLHPRNLITLPFVCLRASWFHLLRTSTFALATCDYGTFWNVPTPCSTFRSSPPLAPALLRPLLLPTLPARGNPLVARGGRPGCTGRPESRPFEPDRGNPRVGRRL